MDGARGVLLSIYGGSDLGLFEINEAATLVSDSAHPDANIIFGAVIDDTLGDEVKITVIAAGFDSGQLPYKKVEVRRTESAGTSEPARAAAPAPQAQPPAFAAANAGAGLNGGGGGASAATAQQWAPPARPRQPVELDEELDVPDFLRT